MSNPGYLHADYVFVFQDSHVPKMYDITCDPISPPSTIYLQSCDKKFVHNLIETKRRRTKSMTL